MCCAEALHVPQQITQNISHERKFLLSFSLSRSFKLFLKNYWWPIERVSSMSCLCCHRSSLLGFGSSSNSYSRAWMNQSLVARSFVALSTHMSSADLEMKLLSFTHFESVLSLSLFSHNYFAHGEIKLIKVRPPKKKMYSERKERNKGQIWSKRWSPSSVFFSFTLIFTLLLELISD